MDLHERLAVTPVLRPVTDRLASRAQIPYIVDSFERCGASYRSAAGTHRTLRLWNQFSGHLAAGKYARDE